MMIPQTAIEWKSCYPNFSACCLLLGYAFYKTHSFLANQRPLWLWLKGRENKKVAALWFKTVRNNERRETEASTSWQGADQEQEMGEKYMKERVRLANQHWHEASHTEQNGIHLALVTSRNLWHSIHAVVVRRREFVPEILREIGKEFVEQCGSFCA